MMKITYIGHNHTHDMDFEIQRPHGSGDYLALLLKSHGLFLLNNQPVVLPPNTFSYINKVRLSITKLIWSLFLMIGFTLP